MKKDNKKNRRHHSSKHFKRLINEPLRSRMMDVDNPTDSDMVVITEMCKIWWNGLRSSFIIRSIVHALQKTDDPKNKEEILKPLWYFIGERSPSFRKGVSRALFTYNFILGQHLFVQWIAEEDRHLKVDITSMVEIDILNLFGALNKIKMPTITHVLSDYRAYVIDNAIDRLVSKSAIKKLPLTEYKEQYFELNSSFDEKGWYVN